jgi:transcriptional regulator with XRE-family HTH domain
MGCVKSNPKAMFGKRIRELRLKAGLSQRALADLASIHRNYLGETERGLRNISLVNIVVLAHALKIHPAKLFQKF